MRVHHLEDGPPSGSDPMKWLGIEWSKFEISQSYCVVLKRRVENDDVSLTIETVSTKSDRGLEPAKRRKTQEVDGATLRLCKSVVLTQLATQMTSERMEELQTLASQVKEATTVEDLEALMMSAGGA